MNKIEKIEISDQEYELLENDFNKFRSICEGLQSKYWVRTGKYIDTDYMMVLALLKLLKTQSL